MKFHIGLTFEHEGMQFRIVEGNRCPGDMVLQFRLRDSDWFTPLIAHTAILLTFKYQVEQNNYSPPRFHGGAYLLTKLFNACLYGWKQLANEIVEQRARRGNAA